MIISPNLLRQPYFAAYVYTLEWYNNYLNLSIFEYTRVVTQHINAFIPPLISNSMECTSCRKKESELDFPHFRLCKKCFIKIIESRIKKEFKTLNDNEKLLLIKRIPFLKFAIKKFIKNPRIKVVKSNPTKIVVGSTLDEQIASFFSNEKYQKCGNNVIFPFRSVLNEELEAYAKVNKIKLKISNQEGLEKDFENLFNKLEKRRPGTKFSVAKSIEKIKNSQKNF